MSQAMPDGISIDYKEVPRFAAGSADSVAYLDEHGFVVIRAALTGAQTNTALDLLWDYLEGLGTGIDRADITTWDDDRWPTAVHGGILPSYGIGHSRAQWFIPGSHKRFEAIPTDYTDRLARIHPSIDHFRFPKQNPLLANTQAIQAHMEAGDMLLWDSRTIHCSSPGGTTPPATKQLLRAASLICMMPRAKSNPKVLEQRKKAVAQCISTTNWSDRFINADQFPQIQSAKNFADYSWPGEPDLNANQRRLAGW